MARRYYTLAVREGGRWAPQFGDYDRETVDSEREEYRHKSHKARDMRVITTGDTQAAINDGIAKLNAKPL